MATLTFVYSDLTAVVGPLATSVEPHSWDMCQSHGSGITVPRGWVLVRHAGSFAAEISEEDDLTALAEVVRASGMVGRVRRAELAPDFSAMMAPTAPPVARAGRRGHLRVLPDLPS